MKVKMEGTKYSRDLSNMALVCTDRSEVARYEAEMARFRDDQARDNEINTLRSELNELKALMKAALEKSEG